MHQHILHATDLHEHHYDMCQKASELARKLGATLYVLHVIEPPMSLQIAQGLGFAEMTVPDIDAAKAVMAVLGESLQIAQEHQFVEVGSINRIVLSKARELGCDLIIIGKHIENKLLPALLDSSAHEIIEDVTCDLLILQP